MSKVNFNVTLSVMVAKPFILSLITTITNLILNMDFLDVVFTASEILVFLELRGGAVTTSSGRLGNLNLFPNNGYSPSLIFLAELRNL